MVQGGLQLLQGAAVLATGALAASGSRCRSWSACGAWRGALMLVLTLAWPPPRHSADATAAANAANGYRPVGRPPPAVTPDAQRRHCEPTAHASAAVLPP